MNYLKRKGSGTVQERVAGSEGNSGLQTQERGVEERSEEVRDDGRSGTAEARVQGSEEVRGDSELETVEERVQGSEEAEEECGPSPS